jgi:hypothetical protein
MHFRFALQLGGTWNWHGRSLCQEPNQPLKILGCGRQVELLRDIPEPPQTYATKPDTQLEFGEQSLDLVPFAFRAGIRGSLRQLSGRLPCRFMPVNEEPPSRSASDKGNLVLGGPFRGSAVFGPADSERHFRPGRTEIGHE